MTNKRLGRRRRKCGAPALQIYASDKATRDCPTAPNYSWLKNRNRGGYTGTSRRDRRRLIEELADALYPARDEQVKGRTLGKGQYINRLWAFMDSVIESESHRDLAKAHVDYLGSYLERTHKLSNKGVHADPARIEAVKAVFHAYSVAADILDYLEKAPGVERKRLDIHTASIDELESVLDISRTLAKAIARLRVEYGVLDPARPSDDKRDGTEDTQACGAGLIVRACNVVMW